MHVGICQCGFLFVHTESAFLVFVAYVNIRQFVCVFFRTVSAFPVLSCTSTFASVFLQISINLGPFEEDAGCACVCAGGRCGGPGQCCSCSLNWVSLICSVFLRPTFTVDR